MDRKIVQAFSLGMLSVSSAFFLYFHFFQGDALEQAKKTLENHGYSYLETESLTDLEEQIAQLEKEKANLLTTLSKQENKTGENKESSELQLVEIVIEPGMVLNTIAQLLEEKGIIDEKDEFVKFVEQSNKQKAIRTGSFYLHKKMTFDEILAIISK